MYSWVQLWHGPINHDITYGTAMTAAEHTDFKLTTDTPYLTLTGKLRGVCCEDQGENWPCYMTITITVTITITIKAPHCIPYIAASLCSDLPAKTATLMAKLVSLHLPVNSLPPIIPVSLITGMDAHNSSPGVDKWGTWQVFILLSELLMKLLW